MKKLIAYILAVFIIIQLLPVVNASTTESTGETDISREQQFLNIIGINISTEEEYINRGEFAVLVSQLVPDAVKSDDTEYIFDDISEYYVYKNEVATVKGLGLMVGYGNGKFEPVKPIIYRDALKVFVNMAGYGEYAEIRGGTDADYLSVANMLHLTSGIDANVNEGFGLETAYRLAFNLLNVHEYKISSIKGDVKVQFEQTENNYAYNHFGIVEVTGRITANSVSSMIGYKKAPKNKINIGSTSYSYAVGGISECLGLSIEAYARQIDGEEEHYEIVFFEIDDEQLKHIPMENISSVKGFDSSDSISSKRNPIINYVNDKGSSKSLPLGGTLQISYNGIITSDISNADFNNKNGYIDVTDTDNDGKYDFVSISAFDSYVIERIDKDNKVIVFKDGQGSFSCEDMDLIEIIHGERVLNFESLLSDTAISLRTAKAGGTSASPVAYINMSTEYVTGSASAINTNLNEVKIGGNVYEYDEKTESKILLNVSLKYFVDIFGKICGVAKDSKESGDYYFMIQFGKESSLDSKLKFQFVNMENEKITFTMPERITYTGPDRSGTWITNVKIDRERAEDIFAANFTKRKLFKLTLTEDGNIESMIAPEDNSVTVGYAGYSDSFSLDREVLAADKAAHDYCLDSVYRYKANVPVIINYTNGGADDVIITKTTQKLGVALKSAAVDDTTTPEDEYYPGDTVDIYSSTSDLYAGVLVVNINENISPGGVSTATWGQWDTAVFVVDSVTWALNEDDNAVPVVKGYIGEQYITYYCKDDQVCDNYIDNGYTPHLYKKQAKDLTRGDLIIPEINGKGELSSFLSVFTFENEVLPDGYRYDCGGTSLDWGHTFVTYYDSIGTPYEKTFTLLNDPDKIVPIAGTIFIYDIKNNELKRVSPDSVYGLLKDTDKVFVRQRRSEQVTTVIYRR